MIGIFNEEFINYLKQTLGDELNVKSKNIITKCPYCEFNFKNKKHYHLYISTEIPIFHCFHCHESGSISKLTRKISGIDSSDKFIDKNKIQKLQIKENINININKNNYIKDIILPNLNEDKFKLKSLYIKKRMKFININLSEIKGLIFDINEFFNLNKHILNNDIIKLKEFLNNNFIGFLSENNSIVIFRNIDEKSKFRHYKIKINDLIFPDYYKLSGNNINSNHIVLGEGIFDILLEHKLDIFNFKNKTKLYACGFSSSYTQILKSLCFYENEYQWDITILSDKDININYYKYFKKQNNHIINKLTIYYNKCGKDFNDIPLMPEKIVL